VNEAEVNERLGGTEWEVATGALLAVSWAFQAHSSQSGYPGVLFGPSPSVTFSFTGRNKVTGEARRLIWAYRVDDDNANRLNSLLGGGNYAGKMSMSFEGEEEALRFTGRVRNGTLDVRVKATLPNVTQVFVERDPDPVKTSFVDWATIPPTIHEPFRTADQFYRAVYSSATPGFEVQMTVPEALLAIPGRGYFLVVPLEEPAYKRSNRYLRLKSD
jgi:hypothetical protein